MTTHIGISYRNTPFGIRTALATVAVVIALAAAAFVVLPNGGQTRSAPSASDSNYTLVHFHGTGAPPVAGRGNPLISAPAVTRRELPAADLPGHRS